MSETHSPGVAALLEQIRQFERNVNHLKSSVNIMLSAEGKPPMFPPEGGGGGGPSGGTFKPGPASEFAAPMNTQIKSDTFFGQKQQTAVRQFLRMRKAAGDGPATPRQIYVALRDGGYQFEAKDDQNALVGIRALLRKRTQFFTKLPNGTYGLTEWYPDLKKPKQAASGDAGASESGEDDEMSADSGGGPSEEKKSAG